MSDKKNVNEGERQDFLLENYQDIAKQKFDLSNDYIHQPTFDGHILSGIDTLFQGGKIQSKKEGAELLQGLDPSQVLGIVRLNLSKNQVLAPAFGAHTIAGIYGLINAGRAKTIEKAYQMLQGLDYFQTAGVVDFKLTNAQVRTQNFGAHILLGMASITKHEVGKTNQEAFNTIQGLDHFQTHGVIYDKLSRNQVLDANFGAHTVVGMSVLLKTGRAQNNQKAYQMLQGLDTFQTAGVVDFTLSREQVLTPTFGKQFLNTMKSLKLTNPKRDNQDLYAIASSENFINSIDIVKESPPVSSQDVPSQENEKNPTNKNKKRMLEALKEPQNTTFSKEETKRITAAGFENNSKNKKHKHPNRPKN
jgi:hypothetical protein